MRSFLITVEPVAFLALFAASLLDPISQQYIYQKLMKDASNISSTDTSTISNKTESCINVTKSGNVLEKAVQEKAAHWLLYMNLAATIPAMFTVLLLGVWSDKAGRKIVLIIPSIGGIIQVVVYILVIYQNLPIPYLLIGNLAFGISGYVITTVATCMAYIADITSRRHRTMRIVIIDSTIGIGSGLAGFISGYWLRAQGFMAPFWLMLACHIFNILYVVFFVRETIIRDRKVILLSRKYVVDMWRVFANQPGRQKRWRLIIYVASFAVVEMVIAGSEGLIVLYSMGWPFCFDNINIGYLSGATSCGFITSMVGVKLLQMIPSLSNHWIIEIGIASNLGGLLLAAFAKTKLLLFMVPVLGMFAIMPLSVLRACMSNIVAPQEQGSLFAAVGCVESLSVFMGFTIFNAIYSSTIHIMSGITFLIGAGILLIPVCLIWYTQCFEETYSYSIFVESVRPHDESSSDSDDNTSVPILRNGQSSSSSYHSCNQ